MGVVYKAEDLTLQRTVALKSSPRSPLQAPRPVPTRPRQRELRRCSSIPNICPVYEIGESDGHTFIAMGYLEGRSLKDLLSGGPLPVDEA